MWRAELARGSSSLRDRRNRVFENQLFLCAGFHNQGKLIEAFDAAQEFGAVHQV